ncbi:MAG: ribonuclease Z [Eubacteriales bacterium]
MVDICLLGCGGMMPLPDRRLTALLYRYLGRMILVDCGEGTQVSIKLAGWGFKAIDAICFTHYHADHIAGLPGLLLALANSGREAPLKLFGPPGLKNIVKGLRVIAPELPFEVKLVEINAKSTYRIGNIFIDSILVDHKIPCLSYSFNIKHPGKFDVDKARGLNIPIAFWRRLQNGETVKNNGKLYNPGMVLGEERRGIKVTYCTDTRPTKGLIDLAENSDLFICEGIYGDNEKLSNAIQNKHMTFIEAATLAKESRVKELWLTHFSPSIKDPDMFIDNAKNIFSNSVSGKDLMKKTIFYDD